MGHRRFRLLRALLQSFHKFVERMLVPFELLCNFVERAGKVESLSIGSRIRFELHQTFARLPFNFLFVLKNVESCRNPTFVRRVSRKSRNPLNGPLVAVESV